MIAPISIPEKLLKSLNLVTSGENYDIVWPDDANIFHMTLGRHLGVNTRDKPAMIYEKPDGQVAVQSFAEINSEATNLASALRNLGYGKGSLIGIHTGQHPDTATVHMAICKIGGTAVTLSQLYGPDSLRHAINDCELQAIVTSRDAWQPFQKIVKTDFPSLTHVLYRDPQNDDIDLDDIFNTPAPDFVPNYGGANDPALLMYTSGSTGKPKGILHGHRILAAYTPSINLFFNIAMEDTDAVYWSPSDWAWVGGLLDMLFPAWMAGRPVVTSLNRFDADYAFSFMSRHKVTHSFLAPTAIKRLAQTLNPRDAYDLSIKIICTGGEALASETLGWVETKLGAVCNEFYGMTEVNHLIGNCAALYPRRLGSMGRAYPGHNVKLVDSDGKEVADGEPGEIVTTKTSPTRFLGYLNSPKKTAEMEFGPYLRTYDLAVRDSDGYFWYKGRSDDLIKSSGFRIGPTEIEECLLAHPSVAEVAVIGKPDADRGSIVKAVIKLRDGFSEDKLLIEQLREHVRIRLARYKAPREIVFVHGFEMTSSGKINRRLLRDAEQNGGSM